MLKAICKQSGVFKYPKVFQCDNGSEFRGDVTKLFEKHHVNIQTATEQYKCINTVFMEVFKREFTK